MDNASENKKLFKNSIIYFIGSFSTKILTFLLLPIYSVYLSAEQYGNVDLIFTISQIIIPIISMQIVRGVYRYIFDCENFSERQKLISSGLFIIGIGITITVVITFFLALYDFDIFGGRIYIVLAFFYISTNIVLTFLMQTTRGLNRNVLFSTIGVVSSFIQIVLNIIFIVGLHFNNISLLLAPCLAHLLVIVFLLIYNKFYLFFNIKAVTKDYFKKLIKFSAPTIPAALIWWCLTGFSKYYLALIHTVSANGIFAMSLKFADILTAVYEIFNMSWQDVAYSIYNKEGKDSYVSKVYNSLFVFLLSAVVVAIPFTKIIVKFFLKADFSQAYIYMPILYIMAFFSLMGTFCSNWFSAEKKTELALIPTGAAALINILLSLILVKQYYIWGTVISLSVATFVYYITTLLLFNKFIKIEKDYKVLLLLPILIIVIYLFYFNSLVVQIIIFTFSLIIFLYLNKLLFKSIYDMLIKKIKGKSDE